MREGGKREIENEEREGGRYEEGKDCLYRNIIYVYSYFLCTIMYIFHIGWFIHIASLGHSFARTPENKREIL